MSITHEREYALAIAFGVRSAGGRYRLPAGHRRPPRRARGSPARADGAPAGPRGGGRRAGGPGRPGRDGSAAPWLSSSGSTIGPRRASCRPAPPGGTRGRSASSSSSPARSTTPAPRSSSAGPPGGPAPASSPSPCRSRSSRSSPPRSWRPRRCRSPRTTSRRSTRSPPWPGSSTTTTTPSSSGPASARRWRRASSSGACSGPPGARMPAPRSCDAEALRTLAAEDGWWEGVRRPSVLTPHAGEFARLRAASGISPGADGDLNEDDEARRAAALDAAATWGHVVVLKGARTVIAAPGRIGRGRPVREPGPRDGRDRRRPGRDDRRPAGPGPRALRRGAARRLPPRHGRRGGPGTRSATRGSWPATFPSRSPSPGAAWPATAERSAAAGSRVGLRRRARRSCPTARRPVTRSGGRARRTASTRASARPGCRPCPGPRGSRSTSTGWPATSPRSGPALPDAVTVEVVVKADAYGHGAVPVAHAALAAGAAGPLRRHPRRGPRAAAGGHRRPGPGALPGPARRARSLAARAGVAIAARRRRPPRRRPSPPMSRRAGRARRAMPDLGVQLAIETGLGRDGL